MAGEFGKVLNDSDIRGGSEEVNRGIPPGCFRKSAEMEWNHGDGGFPFWELVKSV